MQERYVLVKGTFGMGGRIHVLLVAWAYAQRTERTLVVDWSHHFYGDDVDGFQNFFTNPFLKFSRFREIVGVANEFKSTPPPPPNFPGNLASGICRHAQKGTPNRFIPLSPTGARCAGGYRRRYQARFPTHCG